MLLRFWQVDFSIRSAQDLAHYIWHPRAREELGRGELGLEDQGVSGSGQERLLQQTRADLVTGDFEDLAILNAARTSRFTCSATKTLVEMGLHVIPGELAINDTPDEIDSPSRRVKFVAGLGEGRTVLKAKSATDALGGEVFEMAHRSFLPHSLTPPLRLAKRGRGISLLLDELLLALIETLLDFLVVEVPDWRSGALIEALVA